MFSYIIPLFICYCLIRDYISRMPLGTFFFVKTMFIRTLWLRFLKNYEHAKNMAEIAKILRTFKPRGKIQKQYSFFSKFLNIFLKRAYKIAPNLSLNHSFLQCQTWQKVGLEKLLFWAYLWLFRGYTGLACRCMR